VSVLGRAGFRLLVSHPGLIRSGVKCGRYKYSSNKGSRIQILLTGKEFSRAEYVLLYPEGCAIHKDRIDKSVLTSASIAELGTYRRIERRKRKDPRPDLQGLYTLTIFLRSLRK